MRTTEKEYYMKRNEEFAAECFKIFEKHASNIPIMVVTEIISDITLLRGLMEVEHSEKQLLEIKQLLEEGLEING